RLQPGIVRTEFLRRCHLALPAQLVPLHEQLQECFRIGSGMHHWLLQVVRVGFMNEPHPSLAEASGAERPGCAATRGMTSCAKRRRFALDPRALSITYSTPAALNVWSFATISSGVPISGLSRCCSAVWA